MGSGNANAGAVAALIKGWFDSKLIDFVVTTGDNNYRGAGKNDETIGQYYHSFMKPYKGKYGAASPDKNRFWSVLGNHDWSAGADEQLEYLQLPRYYDVNFGLVHLYALDADDHEPDGVKQSSLQALWFHERINASKSCFDIVVFHQPAYSYGGYGPNKYMQWPFEQWGADAVIQGHDHVYERMRIGGIPYFVNGLGGMKVYSFGHLNDLTSAVSLEMKYNKDTTEPQPYGAQRVVATKDGITFEYIHSSGKVIDGPQTYKKNCN